MLLESMAVPILAGCSYIVCALLYYLDAKKKNPVAIIWVGLSILYVIPSFFDSGRSGYDGFGVAWLNFQPIDVVKAQIYSFCILILFLVFRVVLDNKVRDWHSDFERIAKTPATKEILLFYYSLFFILAALSVISYGRLADAGGGIGWAARREVLGGLDASIMGLLFKFLSGFSLLWVLRKGYLNLSLQIILYVVAFIYLGGSRFYVVIVFLPMLSYWMAAKNILMRFFLVTSSYFFMSVGMGVLRAMRFKSSLEERLQLILNPVSTLGDVTSSFHGEDSLRFFYYSYVSGDAYLHSFFSLQYFFRTLMVFIPSAIAPFKPDNFEYDMHFAASGEIATMHPTLFGSIYADSKYLGFLWVLLIIFFFYVFPSFFKLRSSMSRLVLYGVLCSSSLMLARGAIYGAVFGLVFSVIMLFFIEKTNFFRER